MRPLAAVLLTLPLAVQAAPADYRCEDGRVLKLTSTPFMAHVELDSKRWSLRRVREGREAVYVDGAHKAKVELRGPRLDWTVAGEALHCRLVPRSIAPENVYVPPVASAPAR
ncbi:hypothetical protein KAK06_15045 [Ideonella sp. 4Y11]|uniref:C-type lysozyme inhibitor domain-containing protein n=1 Tax=Ideonella aquatica TaxID=2824119 RepID=A0A941BLZ7_9BURK|nr:hypothetical protein [Ideonella aquatica]MBQ0960269.1 hypothetical protein [Ideonella aquatica]